MKYIFRLMTVIAIVAVSAAFTSTTDKDVNSCKHDVVLLEDSNISIEEAKGMSREETIKFPIAEQKAIYRTWTAEKQKLVWQIKLLKTAKLYKGKQKKMIIDAVNFIEPSMETIKKLFPDANEARTIFSSLYVIGETQTPFQYMLEASVDNNMQQYPCDCSLVYNQDYCWYGLVCGHTPCENESGCGFMFLYMCDGNCGPSGGGGGGGEQDDDDCEPDC